MDQTHRFLDGSERTWRCAEGWENWVREEFVPTLPELLQGEVIKESTVRKVVRVTSSDGRVVIAKSYRLRGFKDQLKFWFTKTRARAEWDAAHLLRDHEIPVPKPLAFAEKRSGPWLKEAYFAVEFVDCEDALGPWMERRFDPEDGAEPEKLRHLRPVLHLLAKMHRHGIHHRDFHGGNILVGGAGEGFKDWTPWIIDLHSLRRRNQLGLGPRLKDLSDLVYSLRYALAEDSISRIAEVFADESTDVAMGGEEWSRRLIKMLAQKRKRHLRSRSKRCLIHSSEFTRERKGGVLYRRRAFGKDEIEKAVLAHRRQWQEGDRGILSLSKRSRVTLVELEDRSVVVKEYLRDRKGWERRSRHAWRRSHELRVRDVPTPMALACWCRSNGEGILIHQAMTEYEALDLFVYEYIHGIRPWREARRMARRLADELVRLWKSGMGHHDLSAKNVLLAPDLDLPIMFVDTDAVEPSSLNQTALERALVQLGDLPSSVPSSVGRALLARLRRKGIGRFDEGQIGRIQSGILARVTKSGTSVKMGNARILPLSETETGEGGGAALRP